jgi:hypothetical protein
VTQNNKSLSPLRQRMIEDMRLRKLSPMTQTATIRAVKKFTHFLGHSPDTASAEDLRRYQLTLVEEGISSGSLNATITGLKFFFQTTLERPETTATTPTTQHLSTGCSVRPAGVRCASSKPSSPDTHRPPHRTEEATRRDPRPLRLASPPDHAPPIFQRRRHRLAQPRVEAAQRDRFRPSTLGNAPTPTLAVPFSPATPAIRSGSGEPGRRRRA